MLQNLRNMGHRDNRQSLFHIVRDFNQILLVLFGNQHGFDTATQGRQQLLFQATNRHRVAAQRNFTRHCDVFVHRNTRQNRHNRCHHSQTSRRTIFGRRPVRYVNVDIKRIELRRLHPNLRANRTHIRRSGVDGFLHHISQLTSCLHPSLTGQFQRLDLQQFATNRCPRQTGNNTNLIFFFGQTVTVLLNTKEIIQIVRRNAYAIGFFLNDLGQRFTRCFTNLTFKVPHTSFTRIIANDIHQAAVR